MTVHGSGLVLDLWVCRCVDVLSCFPAGHLTKLLFACTKVRISGKEMVRGGALQPLEDFFFKYLIQFLIIHIYVVVGGACQCGCLQHPGEGVDPLEVEFQGVVSRLIWVLCKSSLCS